MKSAATKPTKNEHVITILRAARRARIPVLLWGDPGIGKSASVEALAELDGLHCEVVLGSIREPSDFAGLPVVTTHGVVMEAPAWAKRAAAAEGGAVVFLDELSTAAPSTQSAMLRVVYDRVVGDLALPDHVTIVAAANDPDSAANGWELAPPMANRLLHLDVGPDSKVFIQGMTLGWGSVIPDASGAEQSAPSDAAVAKARAEVAAFIQSHPQLLHTMPANESEAGRAWPSPRTWEFAATILPYLPDEAVLTAVAGLVGEGAALTFLTWRKNADLPDPTKVLDDPTCFDWTAKADRVHAVLTGVCAVVAVDGSKAAWAKGWAVLAACVGANAADNAAEAARTLTRCRPDKALFPASAKVFLPVLKRAGLAEGLKAA
jgi:hypothetical protein